MNTNHPNNINCPICKTKTVYAYNVDNQKIKNGLLKIFNIEISNNVLKINYSMRTCSNCSLTFADPLRAGDNDFYNFITSQNGYYTNFRKEYQIIWDNLKQLNHSIKLLDVGCGDGSFLEGCLDNSKVKPVGIDTTLESVIKTKSKGIEAYQTGIENFDQNDFDMIVSFHCLEHIENPVDFVATMMEKLNTNGKLFISTPYSPMSYEYFWLHPLNNPPHHTLRLNKKSYKAIAKKLNLNIRFHNFDKMSVKSHIASCFSYAKFGGIVKGNLYKQMLLSPLLSLKVIAKILNREKFDGIIAGNEILVELYK